MILDVQNRVTTIETSNLPALDSRVTGTESDIVTINARVQTLETNVPALDTQVQAIDARVQTLETDVPALDTRVQTLETNVPALDTRVQTLETNVPALDTRVQTLETDVPAIDTRVQTLETSTITSITRTMAGPGGWVDVAGGASGKEELLRSDACSLAGYTCKVLTPECRVHSSTWDKANFLGLYHASDTRIDCVFWVKAGLTAKLSVKSSCLCWK